MTAAFSRRSREIGFRPAQAFGARRGGLVFAPEDNAEDYAEEILAADKGEDDVERLFHGGPFTSMEFNGDTCKIE